MTVAELIEKLEQMPKDAEIHLPYEEEIISVEYDESDGNVWLDTNG